MQLIDHQTNPPGISGRVFVSSGLIVILITWAALYGVFRDWRVHYRERAAYAAVVLTPALDPIASVVPRDVRPEAWRQTVADTHAMLATVSASNLLDRVQIAELAGRLNILAASARPETARKTLEKVWDEMESRIGPAVVARHPRPKILLHRH